MTISEPIDVLTADANYRSPPPFAEWSRPIGDNTRLQRYLQRLETLGGASSEVMREALRVVRRAAAVDTGALEQLYEVDRGFTFTVATEVAAWQALVDEKGHKAGALIASQLDAYEFVLDFATGRQPIAEAWIRDLHSVICAGQETYPVVTPIGIQHQPLPKGVYKSLPNHVIDRHGKVHSYAPVDVTGAEMHRLVLELQSESFLQAHPVLQASYAHYAFVVIHPFADGNGRVARALASVYTYRAYRVPLLILAETREEYLINLEDADHGTYQGFGNFIHERTLDALELAYESFRTAVKPSAQESFTALTRLFVTKGGLTESEVDQAGERLVGALAEELEKQAVGYGVPGQISVTVDRYPRHYEMTDKAYRLPMNPTVPGVRMRFTTAPPATSENVLELYAEVPKDAGRHDDLVLRAWPDGEVFGARVSEVWPKLTDSARMRLRMFAEQLLRDALAGLLAGARHAKQQQGY